MASTTQTPHLDISATPAAGQNIFHEGKEYTTIKEGLAHILVPASSQKVPQTTPNGDNAPQSVFYNPIQQFNRDLSVLAIKAYGEDVVEQKRKATEKKAANAEKHKSQQGKKRKRGLDEAGKSGESNSLPEGDGNLDHVTVAKSGVAAMETESAVVVDGQGDIEMNTKTAEDDLAIRKQKREQEIANLRHKLEAVEKALLVEGILNTPVHKALVSQQGSYRDIIRKKEAQLSDAAQPTEKIPKSPKIHFTILDALSATGLRALRYSHEIPFTSSVTANDLLPEATKTIEMNVQHNKLQDKIKPITGNAMSHMYSLIEDPLEAQKKSNKPSKKYDVIDLDPYGTAAPFLDGAVQAVRDNGGLLCVTCTDAGVWASNGCPEKAYSLYGGTTIKGMHSHEGGLRLILNMIASSAARYGLSIEPLLSLSIDFYARVFVRIYKSPQDVKFLSGKSMIVYNCDVGCGAWTTQMLGRNRLMPNKNKSGHFWKFGYAQGPTSNDQCQHCGFKMHMAGPMWAGPLHSADFIKKILADLPNVDKTVYQTTTRIEGMLTLALEEILAAPEDPDSPTVKTKTGRYDPAELDPTPFFFMPGAVSKVLHTMTPDENSLRGALRHAGYRVTRSHTKGGSLKTDAPWEVIWEVMREWATTKSPIKEGSLKLGTAGYAIMGLGGQSSHPDVKEEANGISEDSTEESKKMKVVFDQTLGKEKHRTTVRYPENPRENWGPMNRARGGL